MLNQATLEKMHAKFGVWDSLFETYTNALRVKSPSLRFARRVAKNVARVTGYRAFKHKGEWHLRNMTETEVEDVLEALGVQLGRPTDGVC